MISAGNVWRQLISGPGLMHTVSNFIIRPPRSDYNLDDLGPEIFRIGDGGSQRFDRTDFELENMRGMTMQCSWFRPLPDRHSERRAKLPCVVYCHANCGGRYDSLEALFLLEKGFSLFTFDCCGSGLSEGEYISLGFYERQDLAVVVEFLNSRTLDVDGVGLWGRSMGAVTAVMYAAKDPGIRCIVCDSPFASLRTLINDLVAQHGGRAGQLVPGAILNLLVEQIRKMVARRAAFDIDDLDTVKYAAACTVPALVFHGDHDDFVAPRHSIAVQRAFKGACLHELTSGGHNDERDEDVQALIAAFFQLYMVEKPKGQAEAAAARRAANARREAEDAELALALAISAAEAEAEGVAGVVGVSIVEGVAVVVGRKGEAKRETPTPLSDNSTSSTTSGVAVSAKPPAPAAAAPASTASEDGGGPPNDPRALFSASQQGAPRMRPASADPKPGVELGTGQTGPINVARPRMTPVHADPTTTAAAAAVSTAAVPSASVSTTTVSAAAASSVECVDCPSESESIPVDASLRPPLSL